MTDSVEDVIDNGLAPQMPDMGATTRLGGNQAQPDAGMVGGQQMAPDIREAFTHLYTPAALSSEGTKYVQVIRDAIEQNSKKFGIELLNLSYPAGTLAAVMKKNAIVLIFDEAVVQQDVKLPTANQTKAALESLQAQAGSDVVMHECIIVHPSDYSKPGAMVTWLINTLFCLCDPDFKALDVSSFRQTQLEISLRSADYENFQAKYNPHGALDRSDLTITIYATNPRKNFQNSAYSFWKDAETTKEPIGTIGAYVTFAQRSDETGQLKFQPEIHISQMTARAPSPRVIPLFLAVATDMLYDRRLWLTQFNDLHRNDGPNIGNLAKDEKGQPYKAQTLNDRDRIIQQYCYPHPALLIDVVEGRARIPGIEQYALAPENGGWANIIENYNRFMGQAVLDANTCPAVLQYREFVGLFSDKLGYQDSRYLDFLNAMVHHGNNPTMCMRLLDRYRRGEDMVQTLFEFLPGNTLKVLYVNHCVSLEAMPLRTIQNVVHDAIRTIDNQAASGVIDISGMINSAKGFQMTPQGQMYQAGGNTPFSMIYGTSNAGGMQNITW